MPVPRPATSLQVGLITSHPCFYRESYPFRRHLDGGLGLLVLCPWYGGRGRGRRPEETSRRVALQSTGPESSKPRAQRPLLGWGRIGPNQDSVEPFSSKCTTSAEYTQWLLPPAVRTGRLSRSRESQVSQPPALRPEPEIQHSGSQNHSRRHLSLNQAKASLRARRPSGRRCVAADQLRKREWAGN